MKKYDLDKYLDGFKKLFNEKFSVYLKDTTPKLKTIIKGVDYSKLSTHKPYLMIYPSGINPEDDENGVYKTEISFLFAVNGKNDGDSSSYILDYISAVINFFEDISELEEFDIYDISQIKDLDPTVMGTATEKAFVAWVEITTR